jgi:excisionase family DNA binding protein
MPDSRRSSGGNGQERLVERLLTLDQAAERLQLSSWTVRRAVESGELRAYKPRGRIRIAESDLMNWLDSTALEPSDVPSGREHLPRRRRAPADSFRARVRASSSDEQR